MNNGELFTNTRVSARRGIRQKVTFQYAFKEMPIYREMFFSFIPHRISRTRLYNLVKHLYTNGIVPHTHGNKDLQELPEVIPPPGILPEGQKYLYLSSA